MKKTYFFLLFNLISHSLLAQQHEQRGLVRELNSNKKAISGVSVKCFQSNSRESGADGTFILKFGHGVKVGDRIDFDYIKKEGYVVTNEEQFNNLVFSADGNLTPDIIMKKRSYIEAREDTIAKKAIKRIRKEYENQLAILKQERRTSNINVIDFQTQKTSLSEKRDLQIERAKSKAAYYARINKDDNDALMNKALKLYEEGKINEANAIYKKAKVGDKLQKDIKEDEQKESDIQKGIKNMIAAAIGNVIKDSDQAKSIIQEMIYRSNNRLEVLQQASDFYQKYHFYNEAEELCEKIIKHPNIRLWQRAGMYDLIGSIYLKKGHTNDALSEFKKALNDYKKIYEIDSLSLLYKFNLATCYSHVGSANFDLSNHDEALKNYKEAYQLKKELHDAHPKIMDFKYSLSLSFEKFGMIHNSSQEHELALEDFQRCNELTKELNNKFPHNVEFKKAFANSYQGLAATYTSLGNLNKALKHLKQGHKLIEELSKAHPDNIDLRQDFARSYKNLGVTYATLGNLDNALKSFKNHHELIEQLYQSYPDNLAFKKGLASSYIYLGNVNSTSNTGNLDEALLAYKNNQQIQKELSESFKDNLNFKEAWANSFQYLGKVYTYKGDFEKGLEAYEKFQKKIKELFDTEPSNLYFKYRLALSYQFLGTIYFVLNESDVDKTFKAYKKFYELAKELYNSNTNNLEYKRILATSYDKMSEIYNHVSEFESALESSKNSIKLLEELCKTSPNNSEYKYILAMSYERLSHVYIGINKLDEAFRTCQKFGELINDLSTSDPRNIEFKNKLATSYFEFASIYVKKNELKKAKTFYNKSLDIYKELIQVASDNIVIQQSFIFLINEMEKIASNDKERLKIYKERIKIADKSDIQTYTTILNNVAWYSLLTSNFSDAEKYIREAIELYPNFKFLYTNLAPALLLQGKTKEAISEYEKWGDKPLGEGGFTTFKEVFLADFQEFEKAGIITEKLRGDVNKVKKMLNEM